MKLKLKLWAVSAKKILELNLTLVGNSVEARTWPNRYTFSWNYNINKKLIYGFMGLESKNNGHMNLFECCDMTKKYI